MQSRVLYIIIALVVIIIPTAYFLMQGKSVSKDVAVKTADAREVVISVYYQGKAFLPFVDGFKEGLDRLVSPADNVRISYKVTDVVGDTQPLINTAVKDLITAEKPDVIVVVGPQLMNAAKTATAENPIPVLYGFGGNPNDGIFVKSMQSSGNNFTGVTWRAYELTGKRLEILKRIDPKVNKILVYAKKGSSALKSSTDYVGESAKLAGFSFVIREVDLSEEFAADLAKFDKKQFDAISYLNDPFFVKNNAVFQKTLLEKKVPSVFHESVFARSGALASFGAEYHPSGAQLGRLAKKIIIDGIKPTDIPSETATQLNFVLNEDTAKKLGIVFPEDVIAIANEIIPVSDAKPVTP